jgi:tetratricopeptide (TPR) repeat protein
VLADGRQTLPVDLTGYKIFIASPSDLADERDVVRSEIARCNEAEAMQQGTVLIAVGHEDHPGGVGRPQILLNETITECDLIVLMFWKRWGSPPHPPDGTYSSGTEQEYHVAMDCLRDPAQPMDGMLVMFKGVPDEEMAEPDEQLQRVLDFQRQIQGEQYYRPFSNDDELRYKVRRWLTWWLSRRGRPPEETSESVSEPITTDRTAEAAALNVLAFEDSQHTARARQLASEGLFVEAEEEFARAVVTDAEPRDLIAYGGFLYRIGKLGQATVYLERARDQSHQRGNRLAAAVAAACLGIVLESRGDLPAAVDLHRQSIAALEDLGDQPRLAIARANLARALASAAPSHEAEDELRRALEISNRLNWDLGRAIALTGLGNLLVARGDYTKAGTLLAPAEEINLRLRNDAGLAAVNSSIGIIHLERGNFQLAEQRFRVALAFAEQSQHVELQAVTLSNLGNALDNLGMREEAASVYMRALSLNEQLGRPIGIASCYHNLGLLKLHVNDLDSASDMFTKSLSVSERMGSLTGIAAAYSGLAQVAMNSDRLEAAEELQRKSLEIEEQIGRPIAIAKDCGALAAILVRRGDIEGARRLYFRAEALLSQIGAADMALAIRRVLSMPPFTTPPVG